MEPVPILVGTRKQMFIDQRFIAQSDGIELHVNPAQVRGPVLKGDHPWEAGQIRASGSMIQKEDTLTLWYGANDPGTDGKIGKDSFCYATSTDGVHWDKPNLGLVEYEGSRENNIIAERRGCVFIDERAPSDQRYKLLRRKPGGPDEGGLTLSYSPDGIHWTFDVLRVLPFSPDTNNQVLYDPRIHRYVAYLRSWAPLRKVARVEIEDLMQPWPYDGSVEPSRLWSRERPPPPSYEFPQAISYDELDPPETDLYTAAVSIYPWAEDVYLAFPSPYYHFPPPPEGQYRNDGLLDIQLAVSRDGVYFERPDRGHAYVPLGVRGGPQGGSLYMYPGLARIGDEIIQYYVAHVHSHGEYVGFKETSGLGALYMAAQRLDGFMSADAPYGGGWLITPPLAFEGHRLELNIDCGATGHARVELRDEQNLPIKGFTVEECDLIRGNHIHYRVTWNGDGDVSALAGRPLRLRFVMRNARLFAFQFDQAASQPRSD